MSPYRQGYTLRSLLENPELLAEPFQKASDKAKDLDNNDDYVASQLAFLGPNIWQRTLPSSLVDLNIESFGDMDTNVDFSTLLDVDLPNCPPADCETTQTGIKVLASPMPEEMATIDTNLHISSDKKTSINSSNPTGNVAAPEILPNSPSTSTSNFSPPPDELSQMSQFSVSGDEAFNPSRRAFSDEELRLQPVLKKSRKIFVPDNMKDDKYWARRIKNNTAAKRSREARRLKENQITMRTAFLERENAILKTELQRILVENKSLKSRVEKYEAMSQQTC